MFRGLGATGDMTGQERLLLSSERVVDTDDTTSTEFSPHALRGLDGPDSLRISELSANPEAYASSGTGAENASRYTVSLPSTGPIPVRNRFTAWSRRYLIGLAGADAAIGGVATAVPASIRISTDGDVMQL